MEYQGWILFAWAGIYMWYKLHILKVQKKYSGALKYIFLEVKIDELNERSPFAMEQVFASLHAIHQTFTWGEKFNGKLVASTSCELVSLGGRVSYIFKIVDRYRNLLESAIFAQYPKAEVTEVEDYLKNLPKTFDPETADYDFWGTQMNKRKGGKESCFPIRTFPGFEHKEQETFIDPLSSALEVMSNLYPYELMSIQIVFKPVVEDWKKEAEEKVLKKLRGNPKLVKKSIFDGVLEFPLTVVNTFVGIFIPGFGEPAVPEKKDQAPSLMLHLSEGQKQVIAACEKQLDKISYETKIRIFYLAPKNKFNKSLRVPEIIGALRNFDEPSLNGIKPDVSKTWADAPAYKISQSLERPLREHQKIVRKRKFIVAFKDRDFTKGSGKAYYNTEELASIFHFPVIPNARVSQVERVTTVKSAPPSNLPVGEI